MRARNPLVQMLLLPSLAVQVRAAQGAGTAAAITARVAAAGYDSDEEVYATAAALADAGAASDGEDGGMRVSVVMRYT